MAANQAALVPAPSLLRPERRHTAAWKHALAGSRKDDPGRL